MPGRQHRSPLQPTALQSCSGLIGACAGIITTALITLLGQARIYVSLGRAGLLPARLAEIHPERLTPNNATILSCLSAGVSWCVHFLCCICTCGCLTTGMHCHAGQHQRCPAKQEIAACPRVWSVAPFHQQMQARPPFMSLCVSDCGMRYAVPQSP